MAEHYHAWRRLPALLVLLAGCGSPPATVPDTGSRAATQGYFDALVHQEWGTAYSALEPESRRSCAEDSFGVRAKTWWQGLGFPPKAVRVRSCDEQGDRAIAHVVILGHDGVRQRFKEAVTLQRGPGGWAVVLPPGFGQARP
jgi:hypothetical protein